MVADQLAQACLLGLDLEQEGLGTRIDQLTNAQHRFFYVFAAFIDHDAHLRQRPHHIRCVGRLVVVCHGADIGGCNKQVALFLLGVLANCEGVSLT